MEELERRTLKVGEVSFKEIQPKRMNRLEAGGTNQEQEGHKGVPKGFLLSFIFTHGHLHTPG
jgi:hypothetical protein